MHERTWIALGRSFEKFPELRGGRVSWDEIDVAARSVGLSFPEDYREFLHRYGAGIVGPYPIFGLCPVEAMGTAWSVVERNRRYRDQRWPGVDDWVIFSNDHAGNPFGFAPNGAVWISDHDFGDIKEIAADFEGFLIRICKV